MLSALVSGERSSSVSPAWGDGNCSLQLGVMAQVSSYETEYFGLMANGTGIKYQYSGCAPCHL